MAKYLTILLFLLGGCSSIEPNKISSEDSYSELLANQWLVDTINERAVIEGSSITFSISSNGKVKGNGGANNYFGSWQINGFQIESSAMASTKMYRAKPQGVMQQESEFLMGLAKVTHWQIHYQKLHLYHQDKLFAVFVVTKS